METQRIGIPQQSQMLPSELMREHLEKQLEDDEYEISDETPRQV